MATEIFIEEKVYQVEITAPSQITIDIENVVTDVLVSNDRGPQGTTTVTDVSVSCSCS